MHQNTEDLVHFRNKAFAGVDGDFSTAKPVKSVIEQHGHFNLIADRFFRVGLLREINDRVPFAFQRLRPEEDGPGTTAFEVLQLLGCKDTLMLVVLAAGRVLDLE